MKAATCAPSCACAARLDALEADMRAFREAFQRTRGARDQAYSNLRSVLVESTKGLPFTSGQLLKHADVLPELRAALDGALDAATIQSTAELGAWLRTHQGTRDGVTITRLRGRRWQVTRHIDT